MPIVKLQKLLAEIRAAGCSVKRTAKGHYKVYNRAGDPISGFAAIHPGNEVLPAYVAKVRKALQENQA